MMESLSHFEHLLSCVNIIKKSSPILKKYLSFILENDVSVLSPELNVLEEQANDKNYINLLNQKSSDIVIKWLLSYLPLFNKNINELKPDYLALLKRIESDAFNCNITTVMINYLEYNYLLIIASIHPAFTRDEQIAFEDNAKLLQKSFLNQSNNVSHHEYSYSNDDTLSDSAQYVDEGLGLSNQQLASLSKQSSSNGSADNTQYLLNMATNVNFVDSKTPLNGKMQTRIASCFSAPPNIETNNYRQQQQQNHYENRNQFHGLINSENEDGEEEEDTCDNDDDDDEDSHFNNTHHCYHNIYAETPINTKSNSSDSSLADGEGAVKTDVNNNNIKNKQVASNTITPIISINDNNSKFFSSHSLMHKPLSRTNGSEPSQFQKNRIANSEMISLRSYGSSFELDKARNGSSEINTFTEYESGMKDAPVWLKRLRLHKYTHIFSKITYDEMMRLNEKKLLDLKVTTGATRKILLEIEKLKERALTLNSLEEKANFNDANEIEGLLDELSDIAWTPMKPYKIGMDNDDALTCAFIKILDTVQEALVKLYQSKNQASNLLFSILIQLIDKLVTNPSSASNPNEARMYLDTPISYNSTTVNHNSGNLHSNNTTFPFQSYQKQAIFKTYSEKPTPSSTYDSHRSYSRQSPTNNQN